MFNNKKYILIFKKSYWLVLLSLIFCFSLEAYEVSFDGLDDEQSELLNLVKSVSQLEKLKESPPQTIKGLRRRAQSDMTNILQVLQSHAYYDAKVDFVINPEKLIVTVHINTGVIYPLAVFKIRYLLNGQEIKENALQRCITLEDIKVKLGEPARPETILNAEDTLLDKLNLQGYAFATVKQRDVFADQLDRKVIVLLVIDRGALTYFGPLTIKGNHRVRDGFFYKKLRWTEGQVYNPILLEKTQEVLELSGLFKSITINKAEAPMDQNLLPVEISVLEGRQRSIGFGLSYATDLGPGITADWEDRNIRGEGEKLSFRTDLWVKLQKGNLTYLIPDFLQQEQNLIWEMNYVHERVKAYTESAFSLSAIIDRKMSDHFRFSYGGMYKLLHSERSSRNGTFDLIKTPIELRWNYTNSLLDPTEGMTAHLKFIPSLQILNPRFAYSINTFTGTYYHPLNKSKRSILAIKLMLGTIIGAKKHDIPSPERFYLGSESALRGYRYLTVSPLDESRKKPLGGRSFFVYSLEWRQRFGEDYGLVYFYELGNVYKGPYMNIFEESIRQSVGVGFRYYTPIGPLRLDFAFPLTPRHKLDHKLEVYFSIGQTY